MALDPRDARHAAQIEAGTKGRKRGHEFEEGLAAAIGQTCLPLETSQRPTGSHLVVGKPAVELLNFILLHEKLPGVTGFDAAWLGGLATSGKGDLLYDENGDVVCRSKSDVLLTIHHSRGPRRIGVSVKTCNKRTPTNDQLYFTTAVAFCNLLRSHAIPISQDAEVALRMFCGDTGYRPVDSPGATKGRLSDPERWFWEELPKVGRTEWETLLGQRQRDVSLILLQQAYPDDPFPPEYVLHQRVAFSDADRVPLALFTMDQLISQSIAHGGFSTKEYPVRKGRFKDDPAKHLAPRFGFIQFQRGGQKQHPTQLQFNLCAGYFNKLSSSGLSCV